MVGTLDHAGALASTSAYSAFGTPLNPNADAPGAGGGVYGYTGHLWDPDVRQWQARARWYEPAWGAFTGEDPVSAPNLYLYVLNRPMDYVDESGEDLSLALVKKLAGAACAVAVLYGPVTGSTAVKEPVKIIEKCAREALKRQEKRLELEAAMRAANAYRAGTLR